MVILLFYVPSIHCLNTTCNDECTIGVENDNYVIAKLKNNTKQVFYMLLSPTDNLPLFNSTENILFALTGLDFGQRFMVMPFDLLLLSLFLLEAFVGSTNVKISQYPDRCFFKLSSSQGDHCTFKALKRLHKLALNCTGQKCGTFCKREINTATSLDDIRAICCPMATIDEICNIEDRIPPLLVVFRYLSLIFSFLLATNLLKWFIQDVPLVQR